MIKPTVEDRWHDLAERHKPQPCEVCDLPCSWVTDDGRRVHASCDQTLDRGDA